LEKKKEMVTINNPLNRKHSIFLNCSNINNDEKNLKKLLRLNRMKKSKHILYDIYNQSDSDFIGNTTNERNEFFKKNTLSFNQYEEHIIPKTQNNSKMIMKKNKSLMDKQKFIKGSHKNDNSEDYKLVKIMKNNINLEEDERSETNYCNFQYGTLIENKEVARCVKSYLTNWTTFIKNIGDDNKISYKKNSNYEDDNDENNFLLRDSTYSKEKLINNVGYLTPTSQKDDSCSFEGTTLINQGEVGLSFREDNKHIEDVTLNDYSPIIIDNFDDICPFENNIYEDERMRSILNAKVLPNDYIGKIPSIPEKPIGELGKLMEKYKI
jgi:hypothetical protein